jgi:hypothetical protein
MKNIAAAFVKAQRAFGPALKTHTNPAFRSKYADLSACVEAVIDALNANGIALMQHSHDVESGVTVETVFLHESGETLNSGKLHVPASKQDPQGYGSALTYARRYSLMAACGIAPEDDDGNAASRRQAPIVTATQGAMNSVDAETREYLRDLAMECIGLVKAQNTLGAWLRLERESLDDEQKTALWTLLDSKTRSAIKAAKPTKEPA